MRAVKLFTAVLFIDELDFLHIYRYTLIDLNTVSRTISILKRRSNIMGSTRWSQAIRVIHLTRYRFSHFQDEPIVPDCVFVLSPLIRVRGFFLRSNPRTQAPCFQQYEQKRQEVFRHE